MSARGFLDLLLFVFLEDGAFPGTGLIRFVGNGGGMFSLLQSQKLMASICLCLRERERDFRSGSECVVWGGEDEVFIVLGFYFGGKHSERKFSLFCQNLNFDWILVWRSELNEIFISFVSNFKRWDAILFKRGREIFKN